MTVNSPPAATTNRSERSAPSFSAPAPRATRSISRGSCCTRLCATVVSTPVIANTATMPAATIQPVTYLRGMRFSSARSVPMAAITEIANAVMKNIVLGARKNFAPGTIA